MLDAENLPKDGPVLMNCNHPGAFLDACLISAFSERPLYYLTRGDMFKKGIASWFLTATHQIPIYRADHGISQMRQNRETFKTCYEYLNRDKVIIIFPEAKADIEKKLRPLYKGAARITFGTFDEYEMLPAVVPVGFTFSEPRLFGFDAFYRYGPPIPTEQYLELYKEDPQAAYQALTDDIHDGLRKTMIYVESLEGEAVFDDLVILLETPPSEFPAVSRSLKVFYWQDAMAEKVNDLDDDALAATKHLVDEMKATLASSGISWNAYPWLADNRIGFVATLLSAPFRLLGWLFGLIPTWITYKVFISKVKRGVFIGPIKSMIGFFIHGFFYLIIGGVLAVFIGWWAWLIMVLMAMMQYFRLKQKRKPNILEWLRWQSVSKDQKASLAARRSELRSQFAS